MKVNVKLYGTLSKAFPEYRHSLGMDVDIPQGATVDDLLALLHTPPGHGYGNDRTHRTM